jgi:regulator of sigma E protease
MFITILIFLLLLGLLVLVHEFGHFIIAKKNGIAVEEFGFGFPPRIWSIPWRGTLYSVNWIPLGGFVRIKGAAGDDEQAQQLADEHDSFGSKPFWVKSSVLLAGIAMNVLLCMVLLSIGLMVGLPANLDSLPPGAQVSDPHVQIVQVIADSPAAGAGLLAGDRLISINDLDVQDSLDIQSFNRDRGGQTVTVKWMRGKELLEQSLVLSTSEDGRGIMGVSLLDVGLVSYDPLRSIGMGIKSTITLMGQIFLAFGQLLKGLVVDRQISSDVTGPIGIAVLTGQVAALGWVYLLQFAALLSVNLAIFNLIPFPALDGGRLLFVIIEKIRGRAINQKIEAIVHGVGYTVLLLLMLLVTARDLGRFTEGFSRFLDRF